MSGRHTGSLRGPMPKKMVRKALFRERHFDDEGFFFVVEEDPVTHQPSRRVIRDTGPTKDLQSQLTAAGGASTEQRVSESRGGDRPGSARQPVEIS